METNNDTDLVKLVVTTNKRKCKCCGKELPIESFAKRGAGYRNICKSCERSANGISERFKDFTTRELIDELSSRGVHGTLKYYKVEEYKL